MPVRLPPAYHHFVSVNRPCAHGRYYESIDNLTPADVQIVVGLDPFSIGELLEQRPVETTRAAATLNMPTRTSTALADLDRGHRAGGSGADPAKS
jgi:hypothetical protein